MGRLVLTPASSLAPTFTGTSITHTSAGVTYTFAASVTYGFYWNGDPFVVSGGQDVTITSITPEWSGSGRIMHGTMVQPTNANPNGFDNGAVTPGPTYSAAVNRDPAANGGDPLVISATTYPNGASVVKAVSAASVVQSTHRGMIDKYSVLTVVPVVPPARPFRPPVYGTDKTSHFTTDDLNFSKLQSVALVSGQKPIGDFAYFKEATFLSWYSASENARIFHPQSYRSDYNDTQLDLAITPALMALHSDYTNAEKLDVYAGLVQYGIDCAAFQNIENLWLSPTTHVELFPPIIALAAVALNSQDLRDALLVPYTNENFFYVAEAQVGVEYITINGSEAPSLATYQDVHVGMPEWRITPTNINPAMYASYRDITTNNAPITALVVEMLGNGEGRTVTANEAYFDYAARWRPVLAAAPNFFPSRLQSAEWGAFLNAYFATYTSWSSEPFRPEAPQAITATLSGSNISVTVGGIYPGSSAATQIDVRHKAPGGSWTTLSDFGTSGTITAPGSGLRFVQARAVNSVGAGPWSENQFTVNNSGVYSALRAANIVTEADVIAAGGSEVAYRTSPAYKDDLRGIWNGDAGYEALSDSLLTATVIVP